jgi:hypothetical protein
MVRFEGDDELGLKIEKLYSEVKRLCDGQHPDVAVNALAAVLSSAAMLHSDPMYVADAVRDMMREAIKRELDRRKARPARGGARNRATQRRRVRRSPS